MFESFFDLAGKVNAMGELRYFTYVHSKCVITQLTNEMSVMKDIFIHLTDLYSCPSHNSDFVHCVGVTPITVHSLYRI